MGIIMNHGLNKIGARTKLVACALALAVAGVSHAQTLVGGGATLPAIGYVGTGAESNHQVDPAGTGSLFGVFSAISGNPTVSYCQTGSGTGKNVLALVSGDSVQNACTPNGSGAYDGFGAATAGRTTLIQPNFAAADSPLAQSDVNNYVANHASGDLPVQFPSVAGAISIAMNKTTANGVALGKTNTNFNDAQLCLIFSGAATDWSDSRLSGAFTLASGDSVSGPINVVYRSDGSGTSFAFSNHMSAACSATESASAHFVTSQTFWSTTNTSTTIMGVYFPTALPANWSGASGNPAVAMAIASNPGSIGYVETANTKAAALNYALIDSQDPEANFGGTKFVVTNGTGGNLLYNTVITGADGTTGRPTTAAISVSPAPTTQCIALVDPNSYATVSSGYPIIAVSYLLGNSNGNGTDLANTQALLSAPYNATITGSRSLTQFGVNTGLELLNTGTAITPTIVSGCLVN
jgi:phosphate transport system substrate-binding protein